MPDRSPLLDPPRTPLVAASILAADFSTLGAECRAALEAGADLLHLDVMDGHFVDNLTMGPALCASLHEALPEACLDVHLMVTNPLSCVRDFAEAGASHVTCHVEADDDPRAVAGAAHDAGMTVGVAINPSTDASRLDPLLDTIDLVLLMSVTPGWSGQAFLPEVLDKARHLRPRLRSSQRLQVDGGVGPSTAAACREAGCDVLVAASAIYTSEDYAAAVRAIRGTARGVETPA